MAVLDLGKVVPEKGIDYFTEEDVAEIVDDVKSEITIPTKTSDLTNDSGFINNAVNNLTNYELKTNTGSTIALSIDSSTYVMTMSLKNSAGTILNTQTVDLPLETMVVSGSYDSTNKKIVLTLKNGNTIDVPVGDLVNGLQAEITSSNKLASDLVDDTNNTNKFVTAGEKTTWNGKQDALTAGTNITIQNNVISANVPTIDLSNYLAKDNTTSYTPSGDYNPATKKYVDDNAVDVSNYYTKSETDAKVPFKLGVLNGDTNYMVSSLERGIYSTGIRTRLNNETISHNYSSAIVLVTNNNVYSRLALVFNVRDAGNNSQQNIYEIKVFQGDNQSSYFTLDLTKVATKTYVDNITGSLTNLTTTDKTNLVSAINEVAQSSGGGSDLPIFVLEIGKNLTDSGIEITSATDKAAAGDVINEIYNSGKNYGVIILRSTSQWYEKTYIMTMKSTVETTKTQFEFFTCASANLGGNGVNTFYIWKRLTIGGSWSNGVFTCSSLNWDVSDPLDRSQILFKNNVYSYTPTNDYNPATKKYVDDAIASAITTTLGGNY